MKLPDLWAFFTAEGMFWKAADCAEIDPEVIRSGLNQDHCEYGPFSMHPYTPRTPTPEETARGGVFPSFDGTDHWSDYTGC